MAEGKKSFVLYVDLFKTVSKLNDNKAGKLFKIILEYVNDLDPKVTDLLLQVAFEPIRQQLKRDLKDWEAERTKRSEAGKLGGIKSGESRRSRSKRSSASKNEANEADNVTVTVNDTVNVTDNVTGEYRCTIEECLKISLADPRWTRANLATEPELILFNNYLEKTGRYIFLPIDYKKYFSTIKDKYPNLLKKEYTIEELKEIAKKMDEQKLKAI